ncbi:MAG: AAA family ATPase [Anaerolineae bacterium]
MALPNSNSAGEQQCLIMMFMVSRWLMPGGIVLVDEPDMHLHVSLQRHFIHELEKHSLTRAKSIIGTDGDLNFRLRKHRPGVSAANWTPVTTASED